ncbi:MULTISPECIES: hypothetical protein [unclassified Microbacterium]|uniref:hypothetical protein n=1 Tax=unclassified Microbacterium TaxID=2609290 RepID=UPI0030195913
MSRSDQVHVIEHRRVLGGDWIRVQTVDDEMLGWAEDAVVAFNAQSGCGDWRIHYAGKEPEAAVKVAEPRVISKPSWRERARFWWVMRFSKRGRR